MKMWLLVALLACWPVCVAAQAIETPAVRQAHWQQDIDVFVRGFSALGSTHDAIGNTTSRGQADFEKLYPPKRFKAQIVALRQSVGARSDAEITLELMLIVASAHVAHNSVEIPRLMGFERALPVQFRWFSDGMIVWLATPEFRQTIGLRVAKVGSLTPEELEKAVAPLVSYENEPWLKSNAPMLMRLRPVLGALHLIDSDGCITLALDRPGDTELVVKMPFTQNPHPWIGVFEALRTPFPMGFKQRNRNYSYRYLDDSQTGYIQYNDCAEDPKLAFADFVRSTMADLDSKPVGRIVVDLRLNTGGDSRVVHPLLDALKAHPRWSRNIYVLIGPQTFSAAFMNALVLKLKYDATLVGEPAGQRPGFYGDPNSLMLPNSKLVVRYTTRYFAADEGIDGASLFPDIAASMSLADLLAGRDPVLEAAIRARAKK